MRLLVSLQKRGPLIYIDSNVHQALIKNHCGYHLPHGWVEYGYYVHSFTTSFRFLGCI